MNRIKLSSLVKLSQSQNNVIFILQKYPNEMITYDGWLTGGHGIQLDMRTVNSLKKRRLIVGGKLAID